MKITDPNVTHVNREFRNSYYVGLDEGCEEQVPEALVDESEYSTEYGHFRASGEGWMKWTKYLCLREKKFVEIRRMRGGHEKWSAVLEALENSAAEFAQHWASDPEPYPGKKPGWEGALVG